MSKVWSVFGQMFRHCLGIVWAVFRLFKQIFEQMFIFGQYCLIIKFYIAS